MKWSGLIVMALLTGCNGAKMLGEDTATAPSALVQQQWLERWNVSVEQNPPNCPVADPCDFSWTAFDKFPHPTFQYGTEEAYRSFAKLLLAFLQDPSDFDFMKQNHLFDVRIGHTMANGSGGDDWSFRELVVYFSEASAYGNVDDATRNGLERIETQIP
jgi:hypothetical protein